MAELQTPTEASQISTNGVIQNGAESQINTTTTDPDHADLFSSSLISPAVEASLQEVGYTIRPLRRSDYSTGTTAAPYWSSIR